MSLTAPHRTILTANVAPVATAGNDLVTVAGAAPYAGVIETVEYVPAAGITGAATNNRRLRLINKGAAGIGTTVVAELQFVNGTDAAAFAGAALTLSGTAADLQVADGDVLAWESTAIATGITDPGGQVRVAVGRA